MSIFSSVFNLAKNAIDLLGPLLPMLLSLIQTKTNEGDREGVLHVAGVIGAIGDGLKEVQAQMVASVSEASPGGTAVTGNEYAALLSKFKEIEEEIANALK